MRLRPLVRRIGQGGGGGSSAIPGLDGDALAWANAVIAAGATYSTATLAAVSNFCVSAKASGYWGKLNRINLFCGDSLTAALIPLKAGGGSATETNVNFVAGDYTEATGLTGNGTTKYLRTGLIPSVSLALNDTHMAVYNRSPVVTGEGLTMGTRSGGNFLELSAPFSASLASFAYNTTTGAVSAGVSPPYGLLAGSRTAATAHAVYKNGSSVASNATSGGALPATEIYVFASNSSGSPLLPTSHPLAGYSIGSGLTAGDATAYATHMETFQDALGRGVM